MSAAASAEASQPPEEEHRSEMAVAAQRQENDCHRESKKDLSKYELIRTIALPLLNLAITAALIGVLIFIFATAYGKPIGFTMAGMPVPALLSIIITLLQMFLGGGITFALSEFKWIRMGRGCKLSMLEIYDGCTRGVGGIVRVLYWLRFDPVLVLPIVFQIGLIALGPSAQQILSPDIGSNVLCRNDPLATSNPSIADTLFTLTHRYASSLSFSNITRGLLIDYPDSISRDPVSLYLKHDYVLQYAAAQAVLQGRTPTNALPIQPRFECSSGAINCTYPNIPGFFTTADCRDGSGNTRFVDIDTGNVTTVSEYLSKNRYGLPAILYAESMYNRTYRDLMQLSSQRSRCLGCRESSVRNNFGDQNFVFVTSSGTMKSWMELGSNLTVYECTLRTFMNRTTYTFQDNSFTYVPQSSTPIQINYDLLSNASFVSDLSYDSDYTQVTAYAFQLSILRLLVYGEDTKMARLGSLAKAGRETDALGFLRVVLDAMDAAITLAVPWDIETTYGAICTTRDVLRYTPDPRSYYPFALCLLIPMIWWVLLWILSLYYTNGMARGNSQVALMVAGLTPAVQNKFQGLSHADQWTLLNRAKNVDVKFGVVTAEGVRKGHAGFGLPEETKPVRIRFMA
ncbi:hypothetical protein EC973_002397 [Apophysomyces ossiformis]|uniref:Uncharacterized protein n=1 Tax=Apophysomyces ossiformis TaxID=679940 RepID=A0A8H7BSI6_9FUNG|nr:hypothetical protein EC973_002397 [Apophysomyces ossiformis]